ncbi:PREDICTED: protein PLANT CADMIUM RESISTANCE 6 [Tarenaya hassleriana]|uniref:protein PLANT CADMIUM RESISTANCE 6 n=1 Tax=Tarenaya hassleriana TaxID=28532 RepID=UPI00053C9C1E|nr:PREDICTED: protein PLANT CADMIUM RESISTANCE 6 [Tarenaya hassleriana]
MGRIKQNQDTALADHPPQTKHDNPTFHAHPTPVQPTTGYQYPPVNPHYTDGIPVNQPTAPPIGNVQQNWSSHLFDCMDNPENALITCCFPFVTFGQIAEVTDQGTTGCGTAGMLYGLICCLFGIPCVYSCTFRAKIRSKYGLPDAPAPDWITHCFCEYCALCQEYRELKHRGLDPSIGWIGNVQRQQMARQQEMMAPPMGQRMMG